MIASRTKMIHFLREAEEIPLKKLWIGEPEPLPETPIRIHKQARILLPLSGSKHLLFASGGRHYNTIFTPGDAIVTHPSGWTCELWDREHRMISVVFRETCIRVIYIAHNGLPPPQNGPDVFFHTRYPLSPEGRQTLAAILSANRDHEASRWNFRALLAIVRETLESPDSTLSGRELQWARAEEALQANFQNPLVRKDLADLARLHPASLSRLLRDRKKQTFPEYRTALRLEHALELLKQPQLSIDAIAAECGFQYTSYFIRVFRKHFGLTPAVFRRQIVRENSSPG